MLFRRAALSTLLLSIGVPCGARSAAESRGAVVVLHSGRGELAVRLAAELSAQGFRPTTAETIQNAGVEEMRSIASARHAVAVMQIADTGDRVSVWRRDPAGHLTMLQEVVVPSKRGDAATLLAFKSVELLRASLLDLRDEEARPPAAAEKQPPRPVITRPEPGAPGTPRDHLLVALQPAVTCGFGGLPPAAHVGAGVRARLWRRLGFALFGLIPTAPMKIDEPEGAARVLAGTLSPGLEVALMPPGRTPALSIGAGAGALFLGMKGAATAPNESRSVRVAAVLPHLAVALSVALSNIFRFRADLVAGWAAPRPVVRMLDRDVASFGRPLLSAMVGLEAGVL
jgi:hypothetical protein